MKKITQLIIMLLLTSFSLPSTASRGDHEIPLSCDIDYIYENISDRLSINENDFSSHEAGTLANIDNHIIIIIIIKDCSKTHGEVRLKIENSSIDTNTGYLKNMIAGDNDEENPINLNEKNEFVEELIDGEAEFYFLANYVKKDDFPPKPGYIQSNIQFITKINDDVVMFNDSE